jgi:DNA-directed RNA polymerase specialized sigma24 family protein
MNAEDSEPLDSLRQIAALVTADPSLQEDFFQEARLRLWHLRQRSPGQRESWYLHGCELHLRNLTRAGRSIDSIKRGFGLGPLVPLRQDQPDDDNDSSGLFVADVSPFAEVSARDMVRELSGWLESVDRRILELLSNGFTAREVGEDLGLSHTCINNRRRRIAAVATRLGITSARERKRAAVHISPCHR